MVFDVVVVGAGAAGCALASRLSEDPAIDVLLLEAGSRSWATHLGRIPRALPAVFRSGLLTSYPTLPMRSTGEPDYWVRGRGIGGSTLINGMMYLRGERSAYDDLAAVAGPRWGWSAFEAAYREIEDRFVKPSTSSLSELDRIILASFEATGLDLVPDLNAGAGPRAGATPASISGGRRTSAAAFLPPERRSAKLRVLRGVSVESLLWRGRRVVGVLAQYGGERREIRARAVVLCSGTIETPLLLERSGIGSAERLRAAGIELRVASPNVGERVREQRGQGLQVRLRRPVAESLELGSASAIARQAARYALTGGGSLARPAYDVAALVSSADAVNAANPTANGEPGSSVRSRGETLDHGLLFGDASRVDIQVVGSPFALAPGGSLRPADYAGVLLSGYPIRPTTTSSIHLDPTDPAGAPIIDANFAETTADRLQQDATLTALRRLVYAGPLGDLIADEDHSGPGSSGSAIYHAVGSAGMGQNDDDVVDSELRVRGTEGLRIADLSVLPFHPSGGTAAPAMAIGWLAGALLAGEHHAG